jgi:hypothetical protein
VFAERRLSVARVAVPDLCTITSLSVWGSKLGSFLMLGTLLGTAWIVGAKRPV